MILFKKQQMYLNDLMEHLDERISGIHMEAKKQQEAERERTEHLVQSVDKCSQEIKRLGMSLEDTIESLEELQKDESLGRQRVGELEADCGTLLTVIQDYQEVIWQIHTCLAGQDTPWQQQLAMAEEKLRIRMEKAGLYSINTVGCPVDYEYHDVITVEDTSDEALGGTVKQVFSPGCVYRGTVLKKGKVSAWKKL